MNILLRALLFSFGLALAGIHSADAKDAPAAADKAPLQLTLSKDAAGKAPATSFGPADTAIYLFYGGGGLKKGDKIHAAWYIVDGGKTIAKNSKVSEGTEVADHDKDNHGYLSIARPAGGWPAGKWRVDVTLNGAKVGSYPFTVTK